MIATLAESTMRLAAVCAVVGALVALFRVRSPRFRMHVWSGVILAALILPFVPVSWSVPSGIVSRAIPDSVTPMFDRLQSAPSTPTAAAAFDQPGEPTTAELLSIAYVSVTFVFLSRLVAGIWTSRRLIRSARPVEGLPFLESDAVTVPITVGLASPRVVLPSSWRSWTNGTLTAAMAHEQSHAARRDGTWIALAHLHRALYWFNPLSWWLARHVADLAERASDDEALESGVAPVAYAETLLQFARSVAVTRRRVAWVIPMARPASRDTERRVNRVLDWKGPAPMNRFFGICLALLIVTSSTAAYTAALQTVPAPAASVIAATQPTSAPPAAVVVQPPPAKAVAATNVRPLRAARTTSPEAKVVTVQEPQRVAPVVRKRVQPRYTPAAMRAKIEGTVTLEAVISADGDVSKIRVLRSLDAEHGLDAQAVSALMEWTFDPATIDGKPVEMKVVIQMEFRLH